MDKEEDKEVSKEANKADSREVRVVRADREEEITMEIFLSDHKKKKFCLRVFRHAIIYVKFNVKLSFIIKTQKKMYMFFIL